MINLLIHLFKSLYLSLKIKFTKKNNSEWLDHNFNEPVKTVYINDVKHLNYKDKLVKTSALLTSMYVSGKTFKLQNVLEEAMVNLVTPKYIIPNLEVNNGLIQIKTSELTHKHLIYALLPLAANEHRTDNIALLEDNVTAIIQSMINNNDYTLNDPYNNVDRNLNLTNFNKTGITPVKALTILAALSFYKRNCYKDWKLEYKRLNCSISYGSLAQLAITEDSHDVFNAAYILYTNTKEEKWKKLMLKTFNVKPSLYPYNIMVKSEIINDDSDLALKATTGFYKNKQSSFNRAVVNVLD